MQTYGHYTHLRYHAEGRRAGTRFSMSAGGKGTHCAAAGILGVISLSPASLSLRV